MAQESKIKVLWSGVPGWAKGIILILMVLLIVWLVYKFYKQVGFKSEEEKKAERDYRKDKDMLSEQGQKPTFTRTQYKGFADTIEGENKSWDTDEKKIYDIFRNMKNDLDIVLLSEAFGKRRPQFELIDRDLNGFLNADLNGSEIGEVNKILASKGIKYRF